MKCSKCGVQAPFNPPNWKKLVEHSCTTYTINDAMLKVGWFDSDPYWILCPDCYQEIFEGLTKFKDRTKVETVDFKPAYFTKSTADYINQPTLKINATKFNNGETYINQFNV